MTMQPPGEIVKPKNEKTRGRPRTVLIDVDLSFNIRPPLMTQNVSSMPARK